MPTVTKQWTFDAAHHLPEHDGKCRHPHGHTYRVEVRVTGDVYCDGSKAGMVIDFADLKSVWDNQIEPLLDHQDLNETIGKMGCWPTTAENIAEWLLSAFRTHGIPASQVRVWETQTCSAIARIGELAL